MTDYSMFTESIPVRRGDGREFQIDALQVEGGWWPRITERGVLIMRERSKQFTDIDELFSWAFAFVKGYDR